VAIFVDQSSEQPLALSIGDLAERTGVPPSTLRTWELRYAIPASRRGSGGHRRYDLAAVELVLEVVRQRASGLSMGMAVERAREVLERPETSVFAGVSRRHQELRIQTLRKPAMLALCRAIEDECCAQAARPLVFASFQEERFYRASERRWRELSRTAVSSIVFADFPNAAQTGSGRIGSSSGRGTSAPGGLPGSAPIEVSVPFDAPLNREWMLVCDSADHPGCVAGWEPPGQSEVPDRERRFEAFWSVDPLVVRHAARICAQLTAQYRPGTPQLLDQLESTPPEASAELRRASGVLDRMLGYLSASSGSG